MVPSAIVLVGLSEKLLGNAVEVPPDPSAPRGRRRLEGVPRLQSVQDSFHRRPDLQEPSLVVVTGHPVDPTEEGRFMYSLSGGKYDKPYYEEWEWTDHSRLWYNRVDMSYSKRFGNLGDA